MTHRLARLRREHVLRSPLLLSFLPMHAGVRGGRASAFGDMRKRGNIRPPMDIQGRMAVRDTDRLRTLFFG